MVCYYFCLCTISFCLESSSSQKEDSLFSALKICSSSMLCHLLENSVLPHLLDKNSGHMNDSLSLLKIFLVTLSEVA